MQQATCTSIRDLKDLNALRDSVRQRNALLTSDQKMRIMLCMGSGCIASGAKKVRDAIAGELRAAGKEDDVEIELALPGEGLPANVDRDAVTGILFNLLDNAYKYSRPPRRIKVTLVERGSQALLSVADNGVGLTARQRLRVFGKFYRATTSLAADTQGAGLGLSLVKAYARAHGGSVAVASTPGEGSTFEVTLPLSRGER